MEDKLTLDRIKLLHPKIRTEVEHLYRSQVVPALSGRAICRFAYTLRTFDEQAELFSRGRTKLFDAKGNRIGKVTNAAAGQSIHNYGLAFDIILLVDNNKDKRYETASYNLVADYDGDKKSDWMEVTNIFKKAGWTWGGDWTRFRDAPHFEKPLGYTWRQLKAKWDKKDFIPGTTYVNI